MKLFTIFVVCICPTVPLMGQDATADATSAPPLEVTQIDGFGLTLRNSSALPIRGWVLRVDFFDPVSHKSRGQSNPSSLFVPYDGQPARLLYPGQSIDERLRGLPQSSAGIAATFAVDVDFVVFQDGSSWGPKELKESYDLAGMVRGIDLVAQHNSCVFAQDLR